jgi:hypothetical protein
VLATGCLEIRGEHTLNGRGEADSGSYVFRMDSVAYAALLIDKPDAFDGLRRHSRPVTRHRDGWTTLSDTSGTVAMENFYDRVECRPAPALSGWSDCTYTMRRNDLTFPAWSLDWQVVLRAEMRLLRSNHHRRGTRDGDTVLAWNFDGNRVNGYDVVFTVRVPNTTP